MGGTLSGPKRPSKSSQVGRLVERECVWGGTLLSAVLTSGMSELFPITALDRVACISTCYMGS